MKAKIVLHHCPPLRAWITTRQCSTNGEISRAKKRAELGSTDWGRRLSLRGCADCPGVLALRAGTREIHVPVRAGRATRKKGRSKVEPGSVSRRRRGKPGSTADPAVRVKHRTVSTDPSRLDFGRQPLRKRPDAGASVPLEGP